MATELNSAHTQLISMNKANKKLEEDLKISNEERDVYKSDSNGLLRKVWDLEHKVKELEEQKANVKAFEYQKKQSIDEIQRKCDR